MTIEMDKTFIFVESGEGELIFLNLYQIVKADSITDDSINLHISDGCTYTVNGSAAVGKILDVLAENSMSLDGESFWAVVDRLGVSGSKLRLIKPSEREP
jgi:hypothetical protein